jgi:GT2 family glycosyltransferase/glycosyltransferase involved in cell wall biosynthesis
VVSAPFLGLLVQTRNEQANLSELAACFTWFDEVLVADMESSDGTVELATASGARVLPLPMSGLVERGRQAALDAMASEWTLVLDADERVTEAGVKELRQLLDATPGTVAAVRAFRRTYLGAREIVASGWGPQFERQIRVLRPHRVRWPARIHSVPEVDGSIVDLDEGSAFAIEHRNFANLAEAVEKFNRYSTVEAEELLAAGQGPSAVRGLIAAFRELGERYSPDEDGAAGLGLAVGMFAYRALTHLKALEELGWPDEPLPDQSAFRGALTTFVQAALVVGDDALADLARTDAMVLLEQAKEELADKVEQVASALSLVAERERERDEARAAFEAARAEAESSSSAAASAAESASEWEAIAHSRGLELTELAVQVAEERDRALRSVEGIAHAKAMLDETRGELVRLRQSYDVLHAEHHALHGSAVVGALRRYRALVERAAPQGTGRRRAYGRSMRAVRRALSPRTRRAAIVTVPLDPPFAVPSTDSARVTIIIPVHGKWEVTRRCLVSLAQARVSTPYEVVLVDDASPDSTLAQMSQVGGVQVVALPVNEGYVGACNAGLQHAHREFVLYLNNDTEVSDGWLDALVAVADADPRVGVVGAKLVYPDGRLQEAGGIIWRDASGANYGRDGNPDHHAYNYVRDVDYCSGACLLVRGDLLRDLGGLDERFAPAYYDDTDLAFAARARGFRVVYQPDCVVVHHEGVSHGTEATSGIKRFQEINRAVFADKWAQQLAEQHANDPKLLDLASRRDGPLGHVLVADYQVPTFDRDSGSLRMLRLVEQIKELGFAVTFLSDNRAPLAPYTHELQQRGIHVAVGDVHERNLITGLAAELRFVFLSRPNVAARYLPVVRELAPGARVVFDTVDLHHIRELRRAELEGDKGRAVVANTWRELELALVRSSDVTLVVSPTEIDVLREECPGVDIRLVSNIHVVRPRRAGRTGRSGVLFVGGFAHPPNTDAVLWFCDDVLPLVRKEIPDIVVTIAGDAPPPEVKALAGSHVSVTGFVEDLEPLHESAIAFIAPLRYGAGVKGKIAEALSLGLPVVTTSMGSEGMRLQHERDALVADTAEDFAAAVIRIHREAELWERLAENGKIRVREDFSVETVRRRLSEFMLPAE